MKIDIGRGKILGTKEVSPNGQVSGFKDYAGREVLVVLPEGEAEVEADPRELVEEITLATQQQMRVAFREYEELKDKFHGPNEATKEFLEDNAPRSFQGLYDRIEDWVVDRAEVAEDSVREALDTDASPPAKEESP
jgi:hypothetical protein